MINKLVRSNARLLYSIPGQPYLPPYAGRPGYWRTTQSSPNVWVDARNYFVGTTTFRWYIQFIYRDPITGRDVSFYNEAAIGSSIHIPWLTRNTSSGYQIHVPGPTQFTQIWEPPVPAAPGQPYIPDTYVYDSLEGWDSGARSLRPVPPNSFVRWRVLADSRAVVVGLATHSLGGLTHHHRISVMVDNGIGAVLVGGSTVKVLGQISEATRLRIDRKNGRLEVFVDNMRQHSMPDPDTSPLVMDVALYREGDAIFNPAIVAFAPPGGGAGSVQMQAPSLRGAAFDEGAYADAEDTTEGDVTTKGGLVNIVVGELAGLIIDNTLAGENNAQISFAAAPLLGLIGDEPWAMLSLNAPLLQGQAQGYESLPTLEQPVRMYAPPLRGSVEGVEVGATAGVVSLRVPSLLGIVSDDDDYSVINGSVPLGRMWAQDEGEDGNEDTNEETLQAFATQKISFTPLSAQVVQVQLRAAASASMQTLGITTLSLLARAQASAVLQGLGESQEVLREYAALAAAMHSILPTDPTSTTRVCDQAGAGVTHYTRHAFESYAQVGERYYGVASDGLYLLGGMSDDGQPILADIDFGTHDFLTAALKSIPAGYAAIASAKPAVLTVATRQGRFSYPQRAAARDLRTQRFDLGRGLKDSHYDLSLQADAEGLQLDGLEFEINESKRRI